MNTPRHHPALVHTSKCGSIVMKKLLVLTAAIATGSLIATGARADVIYDGGAPDHYTIYFADTTYDYTEAAESFTLNAGANTIGDINWWGGCVPGTCPAGNFSVNFYTNNNGSPGTLIASYPGGNANQTATGNSIASLSEYSYSVSIPNLTLTAGTEYWLGISDTTDSSFIWGWETTNETGGHAQLLTGTGWTAQPDNLAFNLTGPAAVPAPVIGGGLPVLLAAGGLFFGAKLLERGKRRKHQSG